MTQKAPNSRRNPDITIERYAEGRDNAIQMRRMFASEGSRHRSEVIQVLVGHETIEHPEESHRETVVTGGHWE